MPKSSGWKFVNHNPYPVILPGKGGENVCFNTDKESSTDPWFGAFVGKGLLTREFSDPDAPVVKKSPFPATVTELQKRLTPVLVEETQYWIKKQGLYNCKLCTTVRTGSRIDMVRHIREHHMLEVDTKQEVSTPVQVTPAITVVEKAPLPSQSPLVQDAPSPVIPEPVIETQKPIQKEYPCDVCGRKFATEQGLKVHRGRKHSLGPDDLVASV